MLSRKFLLVLTCVVTALVGVQEARADISSAAVLFLRIAPGSRAASMGDAFVAISDDATASHWNPAGLGTYPLASNWQNADLSGITGGQYTSDEPTNVDSNGVYMTADSGASTAVRVKLSRFAALKSRSAQDFSAYDLWAIIGDGLGRYDNKKWHFEELFSTKTDQTLESIVSSYFGIDDEAQVKAMAARVAALNSEKTRNEVVALKDSIASLLPETYTLRESMLGYLDSLVAAYDKAKINWERYKEIDKSLSDGLKDGQLDNGELDQINFAVEKARNRFIPEDIRMPYKILFDGAPTCITATEKELLIGSHSGLVVYNGKRWRVLTTNSGMPSNNITSLYSNEKEAFIGTDRGVAAFAGLEATTIADSNIVPVGPVQALGAGDAGNVWAVINNDLYHFDGTNWSNSRPFSVGIDDSPKTIAQNMGMYGSPEEIARYIEKLTDVNRVLAQAINGPNEVVGDLDAPAANDTTAVVDSLEADSAEMAVTGLSEEPADIPAEEMDVAEFDLNTVMQPGNQIRIPFCAGIKGDVRDLHVDRDGRVWLGTEFGIWMFDGNRWYSPGYRDITAEEGQTLASLVAAKKHHTPEDAEAYRKVLMTLNDVTDGNIEAGRHLKVYRNPAALPVNSVAGSSGSVYFATVDGLLEFDGAAWRRNDLKGLEHGNVEDIESQGDEVWFASDQNIVIKANGRSEIAFMHVNWLPELASDLYYEFLGAAIGKEGIGTFGGNVTFITYGSINRTGESGQPLGTFEAFDIAFTGSFGTSLTDKLRGGVSMKLIYSRLADVGAGAEKGSGTSTGFAGDVGLLYEWTPRLNLGFAITNIGPKMAYIDAAQADPLPTNMALGFAYKLLHSDYYQFLVTAEANKMLVGWTGGFKEFKTSEGLVLNGGAEFSYANLIALRGGYIYDDEGQVKTVTLGVGLRPIDRLRFDFAYIPSNADVVLANTLRMSIAFVP